MAKAKKNTKEIEGHYNFYGVPAYILRQKDGAYASGIFDPIEGVYKAGGSVKRILWDGIKINFTEARRLIKRHSRLNFVGPTKEADLPDWILLPEEATLFRTQSLAMRHEGTDLFKKLSNKILKKDKRGGA